MLTRLNHWFGRFCGSTRMARRSARKNIALRRQGLRIEPLEDRRMLALTPQLVGIFNQAGNVQQLVSIGNTLYFQAHNNANGAELWKSDGTNAGTVLVRDINPGANDSNPQNLVNVDGVLFFQADDGANGRELWRSDGTSAGTVLVKNINTGSASSSPQNLINYGNILFFTANDAVHGNELWRSDGSFLGTVLVEDIDTGSGGADSSDPASLTNVAGTLVFSANNFGDLYKTTGGGVTLIKDFDFTDITSFTEVNGRLYFVAVSTTGLTSALWKSDGTSGGTELVTDFNGAGGSFSRLFNYGGTLFFAAATSSGDLELWQTDGTSLGTILVKDINPSGTSGLGPFTELNGALLFPATDGINGIELWRSGGVSSATNLLKDIRPGSPSSNPSDLFNFNGTLYFQATDASGDRELWKSDGSSTGTVLVKDIIPGPYNGSRPRSFTNVNGTLFFTTGVINTADALWKLVDSPAQVSLGVSSSTLAENGGTTNVIASLNTSSSEDVIVNLTFSIGGNATNNVDYSASATQIIIPAGQISRSITLTGLNDVVTDPNETIAVRITSAIFGAVENGTQLQTVTITDDEAPPAVTLSVTGSPMAENGGVATVTATLSNLSSQTVTTVLFFTGTATLDTDYSRSSFVIFIDPGQTSGTVTVTGLNDAQSEGNETILIDVIQVDNGSENGTQQASIVILDGQSPTVPSVSISLSDSLVAENGGTTTVRATLNSVPGQNVTVNLGFTGTATNNADYSRSSAQIVIPAGQTSGSITVTGIDDSDIESNETVVVDILSVTNGTENGSQQVVATIVDDDSAPHGPFTVVGTSLTITGTAGDDGLLVQFLSPTSFFANINGTQQSFDTTMVNSIVFNGGAGNDALLFYTPAGASAATLSTAGVTVNGTGYTFNATNLEYKYLFGGTNDSATFSDSAGNDQLYQLPAYTLMLDNTLSFYNQVIGFGSSTANATAGSDILLVYGTAANDTYAASTTNSTLTSTGLSLIGNGFDQVFAFGSGGNDTANFTGSAGDDLFYGLGGYGFEVVVSGAFLQYFIGFSQTTATAGTGNDSAIFFDAGGNDTFTGSPNSASMTGPGFSDAITGFDSVFAIASGGGTDTANLDGSDQDDIFSGNALDAALFRPGVYLLQVYGFEQVNANLSSSNGTDLAELIDGAGNDVINASGSTAEITYAAGNKTKVGAFDFVFAKNQNGGTNTKQVVEPLAFQLLFEGAWV